MADSTTERARLREEIARILHNANTGSIVPDDSDPTKYGAMADALIDARFGTDGGVKLASMLSEWAGGEPYEISQARTRSEEFPVPEGQDQGFLNGYAAAVSHVEAILEESAVVPSAGSTAGLPMRSPRISSPPRKRPRRPTTWPSVFRSTGGSAESTGPTLGS